MRLAVRLFAGFILVLAEISAAAAEKRVAPSRASLASVGTR
jgi:hypothetical protein